jgi:hypothetical protein
MVNHPHRWLAQVSPDDPDCPLCPAVKGAVDRGALVFAAAGNDPRVLCCPARSEGVIAVGFQRGTRRIVTGPNGKSLENASAAGPGQQSVAWDLGVDEIDGVPGTSFACPLYAGVGALGLSAAEVDGYGASTRFGRLAMTWHAYLRAGAFTPERLAATGKFYERSLMCLPHVHSTVEACLRPDVRSSDPSTCWSCGIFAEGTYVSAGLFFLETGRLAEGTGLLQAARRLAPWSVDAAANLGLAHECAGALAEALACYDAALEMRPGFTAYIEKRERIRRQMAARH